MTLEVQIVTYGAEGLKRVGMMTLPRMQGVSYFVSFQNPGHEDYTIPESIASRDDVEIYEHFTKGSNVNRNVALSRGDSDIILFADDDLHYTSEGLKAVIDIFANNPGLDYATFMHIGGDNKYFPDFEFDFEAGRKEPKGYYFSAIELAVRRSSLTPCIRYSAHFGIGMSVFPNGEDTIFLLRLQKASLKGRFFPKVIVTHPGVSTGNRQATPGVLRTQGAYFRMRYGIVGGILHLLRDIPRRNAAPLTAMRYMLEGFVIVPKYLNHDCSDKKITRHHDEQSL